jgi:hypothetical protein
MTHEKLTGIEFLRRVVAIADRTEEAVFDDLNTAQVIKLVCACWESEFDIYADQLTSAERVYAARHGRLSPSAVKRLNEEG